MRKASRFFSPRQARARDPTRFNELKKRLGSISATSLVERLKELEQLGIVQRRVYPEIPPRVEYSLTKKGRELHALLLQLADWVIRWNKKPLLISEPTKQKKAHC
jgi:DNA-binding HxlR family transcriptional regulator